MSEDERLPQELKEAILHQLYSAGDIQALATCALAHRSLYPVAQTYLFRDISLHGSLPACRLYRSLKENPRLIRYVRVLHVEDSAEEWIVRSHELPEILSDVDNIQELHFHPSPIAYDMLPSGLRDALLGTISLPSMRVLSLACVIDLPWNIFANMSRLQDLRLSCVNLNEEERIELIDWSSSPIRLYALTLDVNGFFFDDFVECIRRGRGQIFSVDRLRSLSLLMYGMRWQVGIPDLIAPCANTLESLELGTLTAFPAADEPEDWNLHVPLPRLRLLALRHVSITRFDPRHWVWLSRLLADAPNVTHIAVEVQRPIPRLFCLTVLIERLAKVLVSDCALPSLKSFRIISRSLHDAPYYEDDQQDLEDLEWTLVAFRRRRVDVKIERSLSHGLVQPPLLSLELLDE
ncbi:hypothetical protein EV122DRAFT_291982 [Schizophyllum commune]